MSKKDKIVPVHGFDTNMSIDDVIKSLNSTELRENLLAMRDLIALMSHGVETNSALPHVIKLVIHPDLNMRRVVYQFLTQFSEGHPQQALMAVNILQRALGDKNALVRGLALRALTSIRVQDIAEVAKISLTQHQGDDSPFVRRIVAIGLSKLHSYCPEFKDQLVELQKRMLSDHIPAVVGAAIQSFNIIYRDDWDMIHPLFHKICGMLGDFDEFEQVDALQMLAKYVRANFADPTLIDVSALNDDLRVIYKAAALLLRTSAPAVVIEAATFLYHCSPAFAKIYEIDGVARSVGHAVTVALVRILSAQNIISKYPVLSIIRQISERFPFYFSSHYKSFFAFVTDNCADKIQKMQILAHIANTLNETDRAIVLKEIKSYVGYSMSSVYSEQQEISCFIIKCISKFISIKLQLLSDVSRIDDFKDDLQALLNPLQRVIDNPQDVNFANDVIFQQSLIELCSIYKQILQLDEQSSQFATEVVTSCIVSTAQIYLDPVEDANQDRRYPLPKSRWPGQLGFQNTFDPLEVDAEGNYSSKINKKSLALTTKLQIFLFQQFKQLMKLYPIMQLTSQNFHCQEARCAFIDLAADLRYVISPLIPDLCRTACIKFVDETALMKQKVLFLIQLVIQDIEFFRAAPLYLIQRRRLTDQMKFESMPEGEAFDCSAYDNQAPVIFTPEQVAENLDQSFALRDYSTIAQFSQKLDVTPLPVQGVLTNKEYVIGSVSSLLGVKIEGERVLDPFQMEDSKNTIREFVAQAPINSSQIIEADNITRIAQQKLAEEEAKKKPNIFQQAFKKKEEPTTPSNAVSSNQFGQQQSQFGQSTGSQPFAEAVNTGITVRKAANYDDFLGQPTQGQAKPQVAQKQQASKKEAADDDYYYSDEEAPQQQQVPKAAVGVNRPVIARPAPAAAVVKPQSVAQPTKIAVAKPQAQVVQTKPQQVRPSQVTVQKPGAVQQQSVVQKPAQKQAAAPAAKKEEDLMGLFGAPEEKKAAPKSDDKIGKPEEKKANADDLLSMLFQ